jgi:hypothetical protein
LKILKNTIEKVQFIDMQFDNITEKEDHIKLMINNEFDILEECKQNDKIIIRFRKWLG